MGKPEAEAFKIVLDQAFRFVRITDAKANLAPKDRALWLELASVDLGNRDVHPAYPNGDNVQAAKAWHPPLPFDGIDLASMERIFARLRDGAGNGWFYSPKQQAKHWAGTVIADEIGSGRTRAANVLATWMKNDVVGQSWYKTPERRDGIKVTINEAKTAEMLAPLRAFDEAAE